MAKVVITIEDTLDGRVKTTSEPSVETLMKGHQNWNLEISPAQGYALSALTHLIKKSRELQDAQKHVLTLPKVLKP